MPGRLPVCEVVCENGERKSKRGCLCAKWSTRMGRGRANRECMYCVLCEDEEHSECITREKGKERRNLVRRCETEMK
ncbi:uncharacterized protein HKW66_Vig0189520 [Vigna angularis]|uniref:Uncharacterized protein n=1 Tax=Phaseolus angularis TaxID=3914 RepID=A0A8T0L119_PHAAN|nr:uncharacterized protein HKW66_Vig0189520 [Vigna angularis]